MHQQHDTGAILAGLERFIRDAIKRNIPKGERGDVLQDCHLHLLENCFHRHDPARGDISAFLARCALNYVRDRGRQIRRQRQHQPATLDSDPVGPDRTADPHVEELAALILAAPDQHLSASKARLLRAVVEHPDETCGAVAEMLGLSVPYLWSRVSRIKGEIRGLLHARVA